MKMSLPSWAKKFQDHTSNAEKIQITVENAVFTLSFHLRISIILKWFELRSISGPYTVKYGL